MREQGFVATKTETQKQRKRAGSYPTPSSVGQLTSSVSCQQLEPVYLCRGISFMETRVAILLETSQVSWS